MKYTFVTAEVETRCNFVKMFISATSRFLIFSLITFLFTGINAQFTDNITFKHFTASQGLSSSWVRCVVQDPKGFIWIGTNNGLNRFDGYNFESFYSDPTDSTSLYSSEILSLYIDQSGILWIGTSKGVNIFDSHSGNFERMSFLPHKNINDIKIDDSGNLLIASEDFYVYYTKIQKLKKFTSGNNNQSLSNRIVNKIFIDSKYRIWLGTQFGLNLFNIEAADFTKFYSHPSDVNSLVGNDIRSITEDREHELWIGTTDGISKLSFEGTNLDDTFFVRFHQKPLGSVIVSYSNILSIHCDRENNLWIGTQNGGLNIVPINDGIIDTELNLHYESESSVSGGLNNNSIQCIYEDYSGNIWLGTFAGGINFYCADAKPFTTFSHTVSSKSINNNHVNAFLEDGDLIWIGTEGGLNRYNKKTQSFKYYLHDVGNYTSLGANAVWSIIKDNSANIWVGTWGGGLNRFDPKTGKFLRYLHEANDSNSIGSNNVRCIFPERDGTLWIGTMGGGLSHFNPVTNDFKNYNLSNSGLRTDYVLSILELSEESLLLANIHGVILFNKKTHKFYPSIFDKFKDIKTTEIVVFTMFLDSRQNIWFGTEQGLFVINEKENKYKHYTKDDGLSDLSVKSILEDEHGNLWLGTNSGLFKFMNANDLPERAVFKRFTYEDGLQGNEFNYRSCYRDDIGFMYFGGINGFNVFHPDSILEHTHNLDVIITDFLLFNKPVKVGKNSPLKNHISETSQFKLTYKQNSFSFKYVALNYVSPEKTLYEYKLEGYDFDWKSAENRREAIYTNLRPGKYKFCVRASANPLEWNNTSTEMFITISPPIWNTTLAYVLYSMILISIFILHRKYTIIKVTRKNQLLIDQLNYSKQEEINQAKLHFFTNLSHEIRTPLTLIAAPVQELLKSEGAIQFKDQIKLINQNVKRLLALVNQLLDFRKIDNGGEKLNLSYHNLSKLVDEVISAFQCQKNITDIHFSLISTRPIYGLFDIEKMTTILYNLISNAVKFSEGSGEITIEIKEINGFESKSLVYPFITKKNKEDYGLEVRITDQGIGIPQDQIEHIFDRYYQVVKTDYTWLRGSGIGLQITREYVELHGGKIWVESEPGIGSCFIFQIPKGNENFEQNHNPDEVKAISKEIIDDLVSNETFEDIFSEKIYETPEIQEEVLKPIILLVEDNPDLINFLEEKLRIDYYVLKAQNGVKGIELANKYNPDLIVSDLKMPDMDGIDMMKILKTDINTSHIPIIILTAKVLDETKLECIETGADAYLSKPFSIELLRAYILSLLDNRRKMRERYSSRLILEPGDITINTLDEKLIRKILEIIESNISNTEFNVNDLSFQMNVSYRVLARKIKSLTNQTLNEFIRSMRLKRAALILSKDNLPIAEVSMLTGFNDPAYFSRCFQKQFGVPPSQYTENNTYFLDKSI